MRNILTAIFISVALMGICALGGNLQPDPGHKVDVMIDGIKFSCPKGFTVQTVSGYVTARLMRHDKSMAGVLVMLTGKNINNEFIEGIANAMASALLKDGAAYKWNRDIAYAKVSKFETSGGGLVGFDGQKLVCFQYRLLSLDGKDVLVGEVFKLLEGAEAKRAFDNGLGGMSMYSAAGESHVIASLTGEMYSDIMGTLPAKSIPRKN
jgi:hypothetical protein